MRISSEDIKKKEKENKLIEKKILKYKKKNDDLKEMIRMENINFIMELYIRLKDQKIRRERTNTIVSVKLKNIQEIVNNLSKVSNAFIDINYRLRILSAFLSTSKFKMYEDIISKEENEVKMKPDVVFELCQCFTKIKEILNSNYKKRRK
ncbi:hypothetical protein BCR36DRAFT_120210 [Piromyces finnis]|uniref:Uncharacterized protein n=1 Tax=Piromyces finnis TaxID=1754191 RepID=A0A1Y1V1G4_9FUNG|nr:hypothetical protein BCR36DRAFT_120210 [Piromyces finnis]|eukprot:ORX44987.1 hypothetical protein BCR36DRAFT_120210 [Piromyces finnis]